MLTHCSSTRRASKSPRESRRWGKSRTCFLRYVVKARRACPLRRIGFPRTVVGAERRQGRQQGLPPLLGHLTLDRGPAAAAEQLNVNEEVIAEKDHAQRPVGHDAP